MLSLLGILSSSLFFFFNDTATTEIYTLSLHDALPISSFWDAAAAHIASASTPSASMGDGSVHTAQSVTMGMFEHRSEEHTSELQSHLNLVCRLLLEKKKNHKKAKSDNETCAQDDNESL